MIKLTVRLDKYAKNHEYHTRTLQPKNRTQSLRDRGANNSAETCLYRLCRFCLRPL